MESFLVDLKETSKLNVGVSIGKHMGLYTVKGQVNIPQVYLMLIVAQRTMI